MILQIRFLIVSHLIFLVLANHVVKAQSQKPKVYISSETSKRYNQQQYDSLARAITTTDPDKIVMVMDQQESSEEVQINFATMTIKSATSVR